MIVQADRHVFPGDTHNNMERPEYEAKTYITSEQKNIP